MKKPFFGVYNPSIILTYLSVFSSFTGIALLLTRDIECMPEVLVLLIACACFDMFDGKVAKLCKRTTQEKEFGVQLDSLADTVSFVAFPSFIMLKMAGIHPITLPVAFFYGFAGIMRLGWFNITVYEDPDRFRGLPVVYTALVYPILYLLLRLSGVENMGPWFAGAQVVIGLLFIANFHMKKPRLKARLCFAALAVVVTVLLLLI